MLFVALPSNYFASVMPKQGTVGAAGRKKNKINRINYILICDCVGGLFENKKDV
jgi:hypothetical protein